jgi:DNA-binding CsgD family transcriptional regulator
MTRGAADIVTVIVACRPGARLVKPPFVAVDFDDAQPLEAPDVQYRVIYDTEITTAAPGFVGKLQAANTAPQIDYRLHPALPMKLMIADLETALLPLGRDSDTTPAAVIVHSSGLLDALVALFEHYWDASMPLYVGEASSGNSTSDGDRRILSLLIGGVTDEAIARQLGISLRTVRRRIQAMMHTAHAQNRAQLAWHAARKNWL